MPSRRLRRLLLERVLQTVRGVRERGLALLMTAGAVGCGGMEATGGGSDASTKDQTVDRGGIVVEAAQVEGGVASEAASIEGASSPRQRRLIAACQTRVRTSKARTPTRAL
jgi:hypothetical protein